MCRMVFSSSRIHPSGEELPPSWYLSVLEALSCPSPHIPLVHWPWLFLPTKLLLSLFSHLFLFFSLSVSPLSFLYSFMFIMCMWHACVWACTYVCGGLTVDMLCLCWLLSILLMPALLLNLELTDLTGLASLLAFGGILSLCLPTAGIMGWLPHASGFYVSAGDPNSSSNKIPQSFLILFNRGDKSRLLFQISTLCWVWFLSLCHRIHGSVVIASLTFAHTFALGNPGETHKPFLPDKEGESLF